MNLSNPATTTTGVDSSIWATTTSRDRIGVPKERDGFYDVSIVARYGAWRHGMEDSAEVYAAERGRAATRRGGEKLSKSGVG